MNPALRSCKEISTIFMDYIQSATVLDVVASENTNSLPRNMVIMCACIVHYVVSSSFTSSFKVCKELLLSLHSNNFALKYPCSTVKINGCACVTLGICLPCNLASSLHSAWISSESSCNLDHCITYLTELRKLTILWKRPILSTIFVSAFDSANCFFFSLNPICRKQQQYFD